MDKYSLSQNLFSKIDGINNEKILGIKLLKSEHLSGREQIVCIKDVADTALMMCGFFSNSLEKRIVSEQYYYDIGMLAYKKLNRLKPYYLDINNFYTDVSNFFNQLTMMMTIVSEKFNENSEEMKDNQYLIKTG